MAQDDRTNSPITTALLVLGIWVAFTCFSLIGYFAV